MTTTTTLPTETSRLLGSFGWFEDFTVGLRIRHARASTIGEIDGSFLAKQVMNTAQAHWNDYCMEGKPFGPGRVVYGLATASTVLGLTSEDVVEHALAELGFESMRFTTPVHHGDTLEAFTEVLDAGPSADRPDAGVVRFQHWGRRQEDRAIVFEGVRTVLVKRRSHWTAG